MRILTVALLFCGIFVPIYAQKPVYQLRIYKIHPGNEPSRVP